MNETHESSVCNILRYFYTIFKPIYQNVLFCMLICSFIFASEFYFPRRAFLNEAIITSLGAIHIGSSFSSAMD